MFLLIFLEIITDYKCVIFRFQHSNLDAGEGQILVQAIERCTEDGGGGGVRGADCEGRLYGERGDAGGAEEGVGCEDHQVGCDSGAGGRVEAGDGENGLHGRQGWKSAEIGTAENKFTFWLTKRELGGIRPITGSKRQTLHEFACRKRLFPISQNGEFKQVRLLINAYR